MQIFKVSAMGDQMFIKADSQEEARKHMEEFTGPIPDHLLTWETVDALPEGEELL